MEEKIVLRRRLNRALKEVAALEGIIEDRSRSLFMAREELRRASSFQSRILEILSSAVFVFDPAGGLIRVNSAGETLLGLSRESARKQINEEDLLDLMSKEERLKLLSGPHEVNLRHQNGQEVPVMLGISTLRSPDGEIESTVYVAVDTREHQRLEVKDRQARSLESVGQLAAGVAHEVNTPIQFLGDSITFLMEAFNDIRQYWHFQECITEAAAGANIATELRTQLDAIGENIDYPFLQTAIPAAFERCMEGIDRVSRIVNAMKEFAHPGDDKMLPTDINRAIQTTLIVAHNEYKYIAEVETNFADFPPALCHIGDINQVTLNLIVNAAHAIRSRQADSPGAGLIGVSTSYSNNAVTISISDNGTGISEDIGLRIFDPFFTTKEVGQGTGQGLHLAHNVVVDRHCGEIWFESEMGVGTTFHIRLPQATPQALDAA